jgi:hypothetical protein
MDDPQQPRPSLINNPPLPGTGEPSVFEAVNAVLAEQVRYRGLEDRRMIDHIAKFVIFIVATGIVGAIAVVVGHDLASIVTIEEANVQIIKATQQETTGTGGLGFLDMIQIAKAYAAETWIPGVGDAVRDESASSGIASFTCARDQNPFTYLMGHGDAIGFNDLNDAAGNTFTCAGDDNTGLDGTATTTADISNSSDTQP